MNQTSPSNVSVFDPDLVLGSDDSNQHEDWSKSIDNIEKSNFIIPLLKDRITLVKNKATASRKKSNNWFFYKTEGIAHSNIFR